ncbi:MAG: hypothetical protein OXU20_02525 [Myxococcales bacterium]|nr:hypothetical protein [Myxococcales bacterium]
MTDQLAAVRKALMYFDTSLDFDWEVAKKFLAEDLTDTAYREDLSRQLRAAVSSRETPWTDLVANDDYEVDEPSTSAKARHTVLALLWPIVFPDEPIPETSSPSEAE